MAPAVTLDNVSDFNPASTTTSPDGYSSRTLLLAPPSLSSHEEKLRDVLSAHDRTVTDLQMLDRLSAGLVSLPLSTYDLVLILTDVDGSRTESSALLSREVFAKIVQALKAGGKLLSQDNTFGREIQSSERTESILAGLMPAASGGMAKPDYSASEAIPLRFGKKKDTSANADGSVPLRFGKKEDTPVNADGSVPLRFGKQEDAPVNADGSIPLRLTKRKSVDITKDKPAGVVGVGFVDFSDDLDAPIITGESDDDDDELIDEDTLLTEADLARPVNIPPECAPRAGKRRRACKDCTCGLAQQIEAEDAKARDTAEQQLKTLKLEADDLAEVDFTVQGKVGSCGNCSLGDAFRCDGCPYIGMPAFKPGEEVRLLNNDIQL